MSLTLILTSFLKQSVNNNQTNTEKLSATLVEVLSVHSEFNEVAIVLESISFYSIHIANFLSIVINLLPYKPFVFCLNPKTVANYKKYFIILSKTDPIDAFVIAYFDRVGRITNKPWRCSQFLALQRLTRHRLHLVKCIIREKHIWFLIYFLNSVKRLFYLMLIRCFPIIMELPLKPFYLNIYLLRS